jgi:hypothetical protein
MPSRQAKALLGLLDEQPEGYNLVEPMYEDMLPPTQTRDFSMLQSDATQQLTQSQALKITSKFLGVLSSSQASKLKYRVQVQNIINEFLDI